MAWRIRSGSTRARVPAGTSIWQVTPGRGQAGCGEADAASEQLPQVCLRELQVEPAGVAAGEQQEIVGDPGEPVGFLGGAAHGGGEFRGAASWASGQFQFPAQDGEGGAELVAGVGDEGAFALQRVPEPAEQVVHRSGEGGDLVFRPRDLQDGVIAAPGDRRGLAPQALDGGERGACQPVSSQAGDGDEQAAPPTASPRATWLCVAS